MKLAELKRLCADFEHHEIKRAPFLDQCTRLVAAAIGCSRAGIWVFERRCESYRESAFERDFEKERTGDREGDRPVSRLHCLAMYDATRDRMTAVPDEEGPPVSEYFLALEQTGHVIAADARAHFATSGFFEKWLQTNNVKSLLAVAFSVNGRLYGAFTCTQVGSAMEWSRQQLTLLRAMGSRVSLALANAERAPTETQPALLSPP